MTRETVGESPHCGPAPTTPAPPTFTAAGVREGVRRLLPVSVAAVGYGLVYGLLARQVGMTQLEATLQSALVFSGTAQFIALELWRPPLPVGALLVTTLIVSLRHVLMGLTLAPFLTARTRRPLLLSIPWLTDENWAVLMAEQARGRRDVGLLLGGGLILYVAWVGATAAGWLVGLQIVEPSRWGLDYAFTAVFVALLVGLWRGSGDLAVWLVAGAVAVVGQRWLPGSWSILIGAFAGSLVGVIRDDR